MSPTRDVGWYRDPAHPDRHRFWDGRRWQSQSEHAPPPPDPVADDPAWRGLQPLVRRHEQGRHP